jgi:choline dehydrogenase
MNKIGGERMSVARCYLTPAVRSRENLRVRPMTLVRRVLLRNRRVVGVEVETLGRVYEIASPSVVLCAGATHTPGILLRSGIGPRRAVENLGVDLVFDLPLVGARLLDHPGAAIFLRPRRGVQSLDDPLIQTVLRMTSKSSARPNDVILQAGSTLPLPFATLPLVSLMCSIGKPRGRGAIEFTSPSPRLRPHIDSNLFTDESDRALAVEALTLAVELAQSRPMRDKATFFWPPARVVTDRARLEAWIPRICDSSYHPCGTVPMGPDDASLEDAATDGRGRVRGVEGLWVADASLMPTIPSAHTNLTAIMMGERFGEWARRGEM